MKLGICKGDESIESSGDVERKMQYVDVSAQGRKKGEDLRFLLLNFFFLLATGLFFFFTTSPFCLSLELNLPSLPYRESTWEKKRRVKNTPGIARALIIANRTFELLFRHSLASVYLRKQTPSPKILSLY